MTDLEASADRFMERCNNLINIDEAASLSPTPDSILQWPRGGGVGTWVKACWVCAAGLPEPLPPRSLSIYVSTLHWMTNLLSFSPSPPPFIRAPTLILCYMYVVVNMNLFILARIYIGWMKF